MTGWWYTYPSEKYAKVSWDDDIPNWMEKWKMFQTTNQITIWLPYDYHIITIGWLEWDNKLGKIISWDIILSKLLP